MEIARRSRGVRLATLFAACLTSATAFGLHPEPRPDLAGARSAAVLGVPGSPSVDATPHDCLACRAHRPLVSVPFLAVVAAPHRSAPRVFVSPASAVARFEPATFDGRAPPDLS